MSYVIWEYTVPNHIEQVTWEEKARLDAPHNGNRHMKEKLVVHNIITRNISETSQSYTNIKRNIRENDGRVNTETLKSRY